MRLALILVPVLLLAAPFAACSSNSPAASSDAGAEGGYIPLDGDGVDEFSNDAPFIGDAPATLSCTLSGDVDPVGFCVQKAALDALHEVAFKAMKGAAASWNGTTGTPNTGDGGAVTYTMDDTVAYAAAAADYLSAATLYGDNTINAALSADIEAIAYQLEATNFSAAVPTTEYSGELYFNLRTLAVGLLALEDNTDAAKINKLADTYGRSILSAHYVTLGSFVAPTSDAGTSDAGTSDAGTSDAGTSDAGHPSDAAHDALADSAKPIDAAKAPDAAPVDAGAPLPDGIIGNPTGAGQFTYAPGDVATAVYALLDLVNRNPKDPMVPAWLNAVRASLNHLDAHAHEPTTGMLYTALVTSTNGDAGAPDTLAPSTNPAIPGDAVLADTQATFAFAMTHAQALVTSNTIVKLGGVDSGGAIVDAGVTGPFVSILDVPLEARADVVMKAINGTHSLWDDTTVDGGAVLDGYMDGYIPSTETLITTKSTRANALMLASVHRAFASSDAVLEPEEGALLQLLIAQQSATVLPNTNLITVIPSQVAYLRGATQGFNVLDSGPYPTSYTTSAVTAAVISLNEPLLEAAQ